MVGIILEGKVLKTAEKPRCPHPNRKMFNIEQLLRESGGETGRLKPEIGMVCEFRNMLAIRDLCYNKPNGFHRGGLADQQGALPWHDVRRARVSRFPACSNSNTA
ncbi:MAG: hypothetical protein KDD06_20835, partial [Phaeodactylibacter sp.]|nr:hypothetical protein [Phaeodactylibacter sp.]